VSRHLVAPEWSAVLSRPRMQQCRVTQSPASKSRVALAAYPDVVNNRMRAGCGGRANRFWKTGTMIDFADVDQLAASYQQRGGQPGLAYGIVLDGELVHAGRRRTPARSSGSPR